MADVLLARTDGIEGFARHVVLKRIKPEHARDARFMSMFLDEARLAATLHHQNVVQVHDIGEEAGEFFFAMEYLHGEDLRKLLGAVSKQKQNIPLANVVAIVSAAAAGLHYAHDRRATDKKKLEIVHRDVSPSNIFIGYDGSVKLVDFGIAKATMRSSDTRTGTLKGKTSYMSPEQCKGDHSIDRRSDVYSLGVVLYELATTTRLFKGESDYLVMDAIVNGKVPLPRVRRPDLPNELSQIIMRALSVDPNRRFQTADEMRLALDQFALNANLAASTSALATYMKKLFGDKPEPWIDTARFDRVADGRSSRNSWSDLSPSSPNLAPSEQATRSLSRSVPPHSGSHPALSGSGSHPSIKPPSSPAIGRTTTGSRAIKETRTSTRMAWEHQGEAPEVAPPPRNMRGATKALLLAGPVALAIGGIVGWQYLAKPHAPVAAVAMPAPHIEPTVTPLAPPEPPAPAPAPSAPPPIVEPEANVAPAVPAAKAPPTIVRPKATAPARTPPRARPAVTTDEPAPALEATQVPKAEPVPQPAPAPPPPPVPTPAPPPVAAPPAVVAEPAMMVLSSATVSLVAGDHAAQLAKCEGSNGLHGDVAISFEINAAGKVTKSQVSSTIKNTKVAACILTAVRTWQFPKPPSGAARGVYTITYQ